MAWQNRIVGAGTEDPEKLVPHPKNWRKHPKGQAQALEGAIEEIGWIQDIIINQRTGRMIDGHLRAELAIKNKEKSVPVKYVDLSEEEEEKALLTLDPISMMAEADKDRLSALLQNITSDNEKVNQLLEDIGREYKVSTKKAEEDNYTPPPEIETNIKRGDIFQLGRHRVMCGDSTCREDVDKLMQGKKADIVFTSPPYNVGKKYITHNDDQPEDDYFKMIRGIAQNCYDVLKDGRLIGWNIGVSPKSKPYTHAVILEEIGFILYRHIVWKKTGSQIPLWQNSVKKPAARHYLPNYQHEMIYLMVKGDVQLGDDTTMPGGISNDVWDVSQSSAGGHDHPAAFPVKLASDAIQALTAVNEIAFEPFSGSGTTLIACEQLDRICYGMEISPQYCEVICQRWEKFTGQTRKKIGDLDT